MPNVCLLEYSNIILESLMFFFHYQYAGISHHDVEIFYIIRIIIYYHCVLKKQYNCNNVTFNYANPVSGSQKPMSRHGFVFFDSCTNGPSVQKVKPKMRLPWSI